VSVLILAFAVPVPARGGAALRILHQARRLAAELDVPVHVATLGEVGEGDEPFTFEGVPHEVHRVQALLGSLRRPYLAAWSRSAALEEVAGRSGWRLVVATSPFLVESARKAGAPVLLDAHNLESEIGATLAATEPNPVARARWRWEASKTRRLESRVVHEVDAVTTTSDHDADVLRGLGAHPVDVAPNGVDTTRWRWQRPQPGRTVGYVGQYGYRPNEQAALVLLDEVLPSVRLRHPAVQAAIIGRAPTARLLEREGPGVHVTGELDDLEPAVRALRALVVPLRSGGGTRLKILEAMAAGTPVVSTSLGAAGLDLVDGEHLLLADDVAAMADAVSRLIDDDALALRLSEAARAKVASSYDWTVTQRPFVRRCQVLLEGSAPA
jgi:glycosyltransferase involved in cell wall biosynthesis